MWPYDYFNQYSNIEVDYKIYQPKTVFWAIYSKGDYRNLKARFESEIKKIELKFAGKLVPLKPVIGNKIVQGNIRDKILENIIKATFVICDITPENAEPFYKQKEKEPRFNASVMWELGIAMAWKMEEQVIIVCRSKYLNSVIKHGLPFDIRTDSVRPIGNDYKEINNIIKKQYKALEEKKDLLIKNIKSRLDGQCLKFLSDKHGNMFTGQNTDNNTIRHLLELRIISAKVYPTKPITYGYILNGIGKIILKHEFKIELYKDIVPDMFLAEFSHWHTKREAQDFKRTYGVKWQECVSIFSRFIPDSCKEEIAMKFSEAPRKFDYVYHYFGNYPFDFIMQQTIEKIKKSDNKIKKFL